MLSLSRGHAPYRAPIGRTLPVSPLCVPSCRVRSVSAKAVHPALALPAWGTLRAVPVRPRAAPVCVCVCARRVPRCVPSRALRSRSRAPAVLPVCLCVRATYDLVLVDRADYVYDLHRDAAHVLYPLLVVAVFENPFGECRPPRHSRRGDQDGDQGQRQCGPYPRRPVTSRCPYKPPLGVRVTVIIVNAQSPDTKQQKPRSASRLRRELQSERDPSYCTALRPPLRTVITAVASAVTGPRAVPRRA